MAMVTSAVLNAMRAAFNAKFEEGKTSAQSQYMAVATVVPSTTKSNTYGWLGQWPGFREWIGDRVINSMKEHGYALENKDFESSVGVDRNDIEDDNLGVYNPMFTEMGRASDVFPDELIFPLLKAGFTTTCYDGQYFFDTDHPVNEKVDGSGADTSVSNAIIDGAYTGEPWFLLDVSRALKPLIYQERKKPQFVAMDNPNDEQVFTKKLFRYGVDLRANAGYGFWQMAVGVKAELSYDNIWQAIEMMGDFKADGGRSLGLGKSKLLLVVPNSKQKLANQIKSRDLIDDGGVSVSNDLKDKFDVLVADFL
ncbi:Mu-like prophage major head subunit gpT family protein [Rheinheimera sp.]|uniref:Mu-like prophage major head subunit gpT family protein n=1 Tax=Rheinheimera sp. TaxID=1869214 RepID=UPI00307F3D58